MASDLTLHAEVVGIAEDYFGPAAPRFVNRLIDSHLSKDPADLNHRDLPVLIKWARLTAATLTHETEAVEEFMARLSNLHHVSAEPTRIRPKR